jgi:hypothetical protein
MKKLIILLGLHFVFSSLHAQSSEKNDFLYLTGELAFGNYTEMNFNLNGIINEKYSLQLGFSAHMRRARSQPDDYSSGLISDIFTLGLSEFHFDYMRNFQILFGKIFPMDDKGQIRLNLAGGVGYTVIKEPTNWQRVDYDDGFGPNYTFDTDKHSTVSLIINPRFEFPLTPVIGITLYPMLQINTDRTFFGIGAGLMLGYLRQKTV